MDRFPVGKSDRTDLQGELPPGQLEHTGKNQWRHPAELKHPTENGLIFRALICGLC